MARDQHGLLIRKWAATAPGTVIGTPEDDGLVRSVGFPAAYGIDEYMSLQQMNGMWREHTGFMKDLEQHGILEWSSSVSPPYAHPCIVLGSDRLMYRSVQAGGEAQDPTTDATFTYWRPILPTEILAFATAAQVEAGSSTELIMTPKRFLDALFKASPNARWQSTTTKFGLAKRASATDISGRTGAGYIAAADLPTIPSAPPNASTTTRGIVELATLAEVDTGTDSQRAVTPAGVARRTRAATTMIKGIVELATNTEAETGTDTERAVTPEGATAAINNVDGIESRKVRMVANKRDTTQMVGLWVGTVNQYNALTQSEKNGPTIFVRLPN